MSISPQRHSVEQDDVIDIRELLNVIWRGKWLVVSLASVFAILSTILLSRGEPTYEASASVVFGIEGADIKNLQDLLATSEFDSDQLENEIQVLYSSNLLTRVVDELQLENDPNFNPILFGGQEGQSEEAFSVSSLKDKIKNLPIISGILEAEDIEAGDANYEIAKRAAALEAIRDGLNVSIVPESTVIEISFQSHSPKLSASIVNTIVDQYIINQLRIKLDAANAATEWLARKVEEFRVKTQTSEEAVESLRTTLSTDAGQGLEITQQQLESLTSALSEARGNAASLAARYSRLAEAQRTGRSLGSESFLIRQYREEESQLLARRNTLSENHPAIPQIDSQIEELRARINEEVERTLSSVEVELETARSQVRELEQAVRNLETQSLAQSRDEIRVRLLEREAEANRLLYENLLTQLNETARQEDLQRPDARVLSPAMVPLEPKSRNIIKFGAMSGIVGGLIGAGFLLLSNSLNNTFRSPRQVEDVTDEVVLATLPALGSGMGDKELIRHFFEKPNSSLSEAVRSIRTSLFLPNQNGNSKNVVMVTSSVPDEGKSTTSMLLAVASQQLGKSTILVDCDLRLPSAENFFDVSNNTAGLLSYLEGSTNLSDALFEDPKTGLHVLMARRRELLTNSDKNAADILASKRFVDLIQSLSQSYDMVILDTPPVLIVTDARLISSLVDSVVYAVRWGKTPRDAVTEGLGELRLVRAPLAGIILTLVDEKKAAESIVDGYRHHRSNYTSYYTN